MKLLLNLRCATFCAWLVLLAGPALAQEADLRKVLAERMPRLGTVDEVRPGPLPGLFEIRVGTEIYYTDAKADILVLGELIDTRSQRNLTQDRIDKLTAFDYPKLPFKDAITIKQGKGTRSMVVFGDPNCGYCRRFEADLATLPDVTIHTFLYPVLGPDSVQKSNAIWCAKDPAKAWRAWMIDGIAPPPLAEGSKCNVAAIERNGELGRKHRVTGTPAAVFADGSRLPGAAPRERIEKMLAAATAAAAAPKR
jgi:thiol:disulfide interchange protein DsbC